MTVVQVEPLLNSYKYKLKLAHSPKTMDSRLACTQAPLAILAISRWDGNAASALTLGSSVLMEGLSESG